MENKWLTIVEKEGEVVLTKCSEEATGEIVIPHGVTSIGFCAFADCTGLTSVVIPDSVTRIESGAFNMCLGLTTLNIPKGVTSIGGSAFSLEGNNLESIRVEDGNPVYDSRNDCNAIIETATDKLITGCKNTIIPDGIKVIGAWAFWGCPGLTSVLIPESVTEIGDFAFNECSGLASVHIPDNVAIIGDEAFSGCSGLVSINIPKGVITINGNPFNCENLESIRVVDDNKVYDSRNDCNAIIETATDKLIAGCKNTIIQMESESSKRGLSVAV